MSGAAGWETRPRRADPARPAGTAPTGAATGAGDGSERAPPARLGRLIGVGLGPGDPDLVTLKAARLIGAARTIAYPVPEGRQSLARRIAAGLVAPGTREIPIALPMRGDRTPAQAAYDVAARRLGTVLAGGEDVVVLCEGDPSLYGSFMYLQARLAPRFPVETVPGVSSPGAAAALAGLPLVARDGVLGLIPATLPDAALRTRIAAVDTAVILKLGRHLPRLRAVIAGLGLLDGAVYVERASMPEGRHMPLAEAPEVAPYFSLAIVPRERDPWL